MVCLCTLFTWCQLISEAFCSYSSPFTCPPPPPLPPTPPQLLVRVKGVPWQYGLPLYFIYLISTWAFRSYSNPFTCPLPPLHPDYHERGVHWPYGMPLYFIDLMSTYTWSILFIQYPPPPPVTVNGVPTDHMACLCTLLDLMCSCTPATFCSNSNQFTCPPCPRPPITVISKYQYTV